MKIRRPTLLVLSFSCMIDAIACGEMYVSNLKSAMFVFGGRNSKEAWQSARSSLARSKILVDPALVERAIKRELRKASKEGRLLTMWHYYGYNIVNAMLCRHGYYQIRPARVNDVSVDSIRRLVLRRNATLGLLVFTQAGRDQLKK